VATDVTGHFATARGMAYVDGILEIELLDEFRQVVGVSVHVVAGPWLAGTPVAAAVMCDASISARGEIEHLVFERICGERPAMAEDHRLPGAPVLVIDLRAVSGRDRAHERFLWSTVSRQRDASTAHLPRAGKLTLGTTRIYPQ
jgi:hypothetical protein